MKLSELMERGNPSWGILTPEQKQTLKKFIRGRRIRDYGCGNLYLTRQLLQLGARHVEGIDALPGRVPKKLRTRLKVTRALFHECPSSIRTAFVSWPNNGDTGLEEALPQHTCIIYLGKNTDGRACGSLRLWRELRRRTVLAHVPAPENDLIVYGTAALKGRKMLPEEFAGSRKDRVYTHTELHATDAKLGSTEMKESLVDLLLEALGL